MITFKKLQLVKVIITQLDVYQNIPILKISISLLQNTEAKNKR